MDNPVLVQLIPTIFSFLTFEELNRCSETCKEWKAFTSSSHAKELWCAFHKRIWAGAKFNVPNFCVCGKEQTLLDRIARVDSFDLVNFLGHKRCEMDVKTTVAKLLFAKEINGRRFTHSNEIIPSWLYKLDRYKASYIQSKLEMRRRIFASDLVAYNWSFIYRMNVDGAFQNSAGKFFADGTLVFDFSDFVHQYRLIYTEEGYQQVQVDQYPPLRCYRSSDGRWKLENPYVVFEQTSFIPSEELPLFDAVTLNTEV